MCCWLQYSNYCRQKAIDYIICGKINSLQGFRETPQWLPNRMLERSVGRCTHAHIHLKEESHVLHIAIIDEQLLQAVIDLRVHVPQVI